MSSSDPAAKTAVFRVDDVHKRYRMGEVTVEALRGISAEVHTGEFLVILGPSGSGKSTLLNIVGGLDQPTEGRVFFRDEELTAYTDAQLTAYRRHNIGFVFQFYNLMPNLTAQENVEMATEIASDPLDAHEALQLVNLDQRHDHFPAQMSGGEQQRVAIARAVAKRPEILLCDEPTGALDYSTGKVVLEVLAGINRELGSTVVIITHNAAIGAMGDRVISLKDGQVREVRENDQRTAAEDLEW